MDEITYAIKIAPVDITPYRDGNTGIPYFTTFDSGFNGPHVMITAVTHGNELCGAIALDFLFREGVRPICGKLSLGFVNHAAYHTFDANDPAASRFIDEDFNRTWGEDVLDGTRNTTETRRAREIRPIIDTVDYLLDIHSMQHKSVPLMMCGPLDKGRTLARALAAPVEVISDAGHAAGKRLRDYSFFGDKNASQNALLMECGQHWEVSSVDIAKESALRFLRHFNIVSKEFIDRHLSATPQPPQRLIEVSGPVTIKTGNFRFTEIYTGMETIERAGTVIGWDDQEEIKTPYDNCVLIMPSRRLDVGQSAVRLGRLIDWPD